MAVNGNMILAYSPILQVEIADSSLPFRAYLAALISIVKDVPVKQTVFPADIELDILEQKPDEDDTVSESNSNNSSDRYRLGGSRGMDGDSATFPRITLFRIVR